MLNREKSCNDIKYIVIFATLNEKGSAFPTALISTKMA